MKKNIMLLLVLALTYSVSSAQEAYNKFYLYNSSDVGPLCSMIEESLKSYIYEANRVLANDKRLKKQYILFEGLPYNFVLHDNDTLRGIKLISLTAYSDVVPLKERKYFKKGTPYVYFVRLHLIEDMLCIMVVSSVARQKRGKTRLSIDNCWGKYYYKYSEKSRKWELVKSKIEGG